MTRIGPAAARRTIKAVADGCRCAERRRRAEDARRTRRAMCAACNGNRPRCPRTQAKIDFHVNGLLCPRGWHPDKQGRVRWARLSWSGVPFPIRLYLYLRDGEGDPAQWVARFPGCGCVRKAKAAWLRLARLYLFLRKPDADPDTWVRSFSGCGCVRKAKAAWLRLARLYR